jgi:group I intron endonuclease
MTIYKITNTINGKSYIGQTIRTIKQRWCNHLCAMKKNKNKHPLYRAIAKYGIENFIIEEIGGANSQSELNYQEWLLIYKNDTLWPNGYNMMEGGTNGGKWSKQKREQHSISMKKRKFTTWNKGLKGVCKPNITSFTKESAGGTNNFFYGKKHTLESLTKMSKSHDFQKRKVICLNTGEIFGSIKQTSVKLNLDLGNLWKVLSGKQKTIKGYKLKYL